MPYIRYQCDCSRTERLQQAMSVHLFRYLGLCISDSAGALMPHLFPSILRVSLNLSEPGQTQVASLAPLSLYVP